MLLNSESMIFEFDDKNIDTISNTYINFNNYLQNIKNQLKYNYYYIEKCPINYLKKNYKNNKKDKYIKIKLIKIEPKKIIYGFDIK